MIGPEIAAADAGLLKLTLWLSPAFPVGSFTYSHGLEWAIEDGSVTSAAGLSAWLADILAHGAGRSDAILLAAAYRAAAADDRAALMEVLELADALQPSRERRLEATAQGAAFAKAIGDTWPTPAFRALGEAAMAHFGGTVPWTYATAVAVTVSAGVRAIPLGQTEGLRLVSESWPRLIALAGAALAAGLDDLGGFTPRADIASMRHETQYTRLFRS